MRGLALSDEDRMRRDIIGELMCYYQVDLRAAAQRHRREESFFVERTFLKNFQERGLIVVGDDAVAVTTQGRPYVRTICAVFDQYLKISQHRYSLAV